MKKEKRILVAPLNWGMGHASRCVPIIHKLLEEKCEVVIAADGQALELLRREFPKLEHVVLPGIKTNYSKFIPIPLLILLRAPRLFQSIKIENRALLKIIKQYKIDGVISDNRYGLYHKDIPSILISHQLIIKTPFFKKKSQALIEKLISKFTTCWVPDSEGKINLSGDLSHSRKGLKSLRYIGPLSRFKKNVNPNSNYRRKLMVLLSGPEPSRSTFEKLLLQQLETVDYKVLLVRGKFSSLKVDSKNDNVKIISFMDAQQLETEINQSELILCRSGYSSIMDLAVIGKKALFVPTPGQTEQEYLAKYLFDSNRSYAVKQTQLDLTTDVSLALGYEPLSIEEEPNLLTESIRTFLKEH